MTMRWTFLHAPENFSAVSNGWKNGLQRMAKPCGPGTRCWCQVGGDFRWPNRVQQDRQFADDGGKTNSSPGRARHKPLKPAAQGMPDCNAADHRALQATFGVSGRCGSERQRGDGENGERGLHDAMGSNEQCRTVNLPRRWQFHAPSAPCDQRWPSW